MLTSKPSLMLLKASPLMKSSVLISMKPLVLVGVPQRNYMLQWLPKYRDLFKPQYYDNPQRRWDSRVKNKKFGYFGQDPLFFAHD